MSGTFLGHVVKNGGLSLPGTYLVWVYGKASIHGRRIVSWLIFLVSIVGSAAGARAADTLLLGWNNLGMHMVDSDYSVFGISPPYNSIEAQLIVGGMLVTNLGDFTVTYQAIADPTGSINSTSAGKTTFYDFAPQLYGTSLAPDAGLRIYGMPGTNNAPQPMYFEQTNSVLVNWFRAEGIPITPYDDNGRKNPYPLMRLIAHIGGKPIATNDVVLPVSDEMDCRVCHASGSSMDAMPAGGWVWNENPERDYRLNILRRHDTMEFAQHPELYAAALAARGFSSQGLYFGAVADRTLPVVVSPGSARIVKPDGTQLDWYGGDDDLSRGAALLAAISNAADGDMVIFGSGTFNIGTQRIDLSKGGTATISLAGSGTSASMVLTELSGSTITALQPGLTNCHLNNFTLEGTLYDGSYQLLLGTVYNVGAYGFTNAHIQNVTLRGESDGIYISSAEGHPCSFEADNLVVNTKYDALYIFGDEANSATIRNSHITVNGPSIIPDGTCRAAVCFNGQLSIYNSVLEAFNGGYFQNDAIVADSFSSTVALFGCSLASTNSGSALPYDLHSIGGGTIIVDPSVIFSDPKVSGSLVQTNVHGYQPSTAFMRVCTACHASEALGAPGYDGVPQLTISVHGHHAPAIDPETQAMLDSSTDRAACYRCHPGSTTQSLRGAMGTAVAADGSMKMQCQSCHGSMRHVGAADRIGWVTEPNCQSCHSGTATTNSGQIRFTSVFNEEDSTGRTPADLTFATNPDTPMPGNSLYRFSSGHGGLHCEACHGSTHAEFPSTHPNDNLRNIALQGHAGVLVECAACHNPLPNTINGGPHGMHPVGQAWVTGHGSLIKGLGTTMCQACHGIDYRGTVLSRAHASRTLTGIGTQRLFRGAQIGCYNCHNGPDTNTGNTNAPPTAFNVNTNTTNDQPVAMPLPVSGVGATLQIISQPENGTVGLSNDIATYIPKPGFVGTDVFTFAAYDGARNSQLATGTVAIAQGPFSISARVRVPPRFFAGWSVPFGVVATPLNVSAAPTFEWDFGDASPRSTNQYTSHTYPAAGAYKWSVISRVQNGSLQTTATNEGTIEIEGPAVLAATVSADGVTISCPLPWTGVLLEQSESLAPTARWTTCTNVPVFSEDFWSTTISNPGGLRFYRLRKL